MSSAGTDQAYRRYFPLIRAKCARMLRDDDEAQDVAQETFVRLWRAGVAGDDPRQVVAWVYRTATRLAIDRLRERRRRDSLASPLADTETSEPALMARRDLQRIARVTPRGELEVAILIRVDGLGQEEAAQLARISDRTVRRLLRRFDERLADLRAKELS